MAQFRYKAINDSGLVVKGVLEAPSKDLVVRQLRGEGLYPLSAAEETAGTQIGGFLQRLVPKRKPSPRALATAIQELAMLLKAGLELDRALAILIGLSDIGSLRETFAAVRDRVRKGTSFANALAAESAFPKFHLGMIRAGEMGGNLSETLQRLADYITRSLAVREAVTSSLVYPALLLLTAGGSITVILVFVLPEFRSLFAEAGKSLPLSTRIVMDVGDLVRNYGWLLLIALAVFTAWLWDGLKRPAFRARADAFLMRIPVLGPLLVSIEVERLMRTFGMLLAGGVPVPAALSMAKDVLSNTVMAHTLEDAAKSLREGERLGQRLAATGVFPPTTVDLIRIGEESGRLDEMLLRQADLDEVRIRHKIDRLLAMLVPALTIAMGAIVAGLIASLMLAILSINDLAMQ